MGLAIVARFTSLPEAQVAGAALRSAGLDATVLDDPLPGVMPLEPDDAGGIRLCVPEADLAAARALLAAAREIGDAEVEDPD
ncbi:DUF2007 domain-containing protein [Caulobacter sp. 17J65-9]|uniref:putative signal transducing protein n=1 Tax=Caulobacter sp. 17J65-9 TaxID=2709382 RepID=UPI0013CAE8F6|nr:DUF2007 domain-containing protein [Caulobacter sp. 17J65-9]NEX94837.1 hypothetical protein [Caulobacter sp. 17J65-9]